MNDVEFYLEDLKSKFEKIDGKEYALSYSGGKDSHFLYWFIKNYLKDSDIEIVGVNTRMEHPEISSRIHRNCDVVLLPQYKPYEVMNKYGSPLLSKLHDEYISRFQRGSRALSTMNYINGNLTNSNSRFKLPKKYVEPLINNELPMVSNKCCYYLKKKPMVDYQKKTGKKLILGVRGSESLLRSSQYKGCFTKDGKFTPLWDLTDELLEKIYGQYNIEIPSIYKTLKRTGCMGCPYGRNIEKELETLSHNQLNYVLKLFSKSYDIKGVNYNQFIK
jgi:3'-phosphoadenosine 5'-phosphosulfate sulfotransferase (PAPS reductase)/FAD synthetase